MTAAFPVVMLIYFQRLLFILALFNISTVLLPISMLAGFVTEAFYTFYTVCLLSVMPYPRYLANVYYSQVVAPD